MKSKINRVLATLLTVVMLLSVALLNGFVGLELPDFSNLFFTKADAAEYSGKCGENLTWTFNDSTGKLVISGTGEMYNYNIFSNHPWESYEDSIKTVVIGNTVTTIGDNAFYWCNSLANVIIGNSVTTIGNFAFGSCTSLTSVTIPDSVTSIGESAFGSCFSLTSVTIPKNVITIGDQAFGYINGLTSIQVDPDNEYYSNDSSGVLYNKNKTKLIQYPVGNGRTEFSIPDSVTSIGDNALAWCTRLTSVTIPDSVTTIGNEAFYYCDNLTSIEVDSDNEYYSNDSSRVLYNKDKTELIQYPIGNKRTAFTVPDSVITIKDYAFYNCDSLTSVTISDSVTTIGDYAFDYCDRLTNLTIGNSVTTIGDFAFAACHNLTSITIPDSVTAIGAGAFDYCDKLTNLTISNRIAIIKRFAFNNCNSLRDVYYSGLEEEWNKIAIGDDNEPLLNATIHYNSGICGKNLTWSFNPETGELSIEGTGKMTDYTATKPAPWDKYKEQIKKLIVSDGVTTIGNDTFTGCENLEEVTLPSTLTKIGDSAFRDCANLKDIEIPATVKTLGHYAFYGCIGLKDVNVGDSVTSIGNYAFRNCLGIKFVTLPETLTKIGKGAFMGCNSLLDAEYKGTDEQWAEVTIGENNELLLEAMRKVVLGDVNNDGKINSLDALYCLDYSVDNVELTYKAFKAADVNRDGKVNSFDALQILNYSVGKIEEF